MQIVIETSKWSFRKLVKTEDGFETAFISPIPTPFNYGFIEGTLGEDGAPLDIIVLGQKHDSGVLLDLSIIGRVNFSDDSRIDDKYIATMDGRRHETAIKVFFTVYVISKFFLGLIQQRKWTKNSFTGVEWFEEVNSASEIQNCSRRAE
jgi:inorganic pyrophosphatase